MGWSGEADEPFRYSGMKHAGSLTAALSSLSFTGRLCWPQEQLSKKVLPPSPCFLLFCWATGAQYRLSAVSRLRGSIERSVEVPTVASNVAEILLPDRKLCQARHC